VCSDLENSNDRWMSTTHSPLPEPRITGRGEVGWHNDRVTQGVVDAGDGLKRCPWAVEPEEYRRYHDDEWGRPVVDDVRIYEKLCLEGFQSGLSWLTILRKRDAFRRAFHGFDMAKIATFDEQDVERLLGDPGIVRHRGKIEATIANARAVLEVQASGESLAALLWRHEPKPKAPARTLGRLPAFRPEAKELSKDLRRRGFRFVGPTTVYAAMQALGVVNDHLERCFCRSVVEDERAALVRPS
jgi:DNA-3-methyladenine glycosylase I